MYLYEYQVKKILSYYGLSIPKGIVFYKSKIKNKKEKKFFLKSGPWVMKCQIHAGGRKKSGGIKTVYSKKQIDFFLKLWLGKKLKTKQTNSFGQIVNCILIESKIRIKKEFYLGIIIDRKIKKIVFLASKKGGIEIEKTAKKNPKSIHKISIDPILGPQSYQGRILSYKLGLTNQQTEKFSSIFKNLLKIFIKHDLIFLEINPFVLTKKNNFFCLDGKSRIDKNSFFRQKKLEKILQKKNLNLFKKTQNKLNYLLLKGNIGCMVNGAGLAMGTMDSIKVNGGFPLNFLDIGGNIKKKTINSFLTELFQNKNTKVIFINIFGGIVDCKVIAESIVYSINKHNTLLPCVVRFKGNNSVKGIKILKKSNTKTITISNFYDAIKKVVSIAKQTKCRF